MRTTFSTPSHAGAKLRHSKNLFQKLPAELQVQIFKLVLDDIPPRIVTLQPKSPGNTIPALMHVCQLWRYEAKKRYKCEPVYADWPDYFYILVIDFEKDLLYVRHDPRYTSALLSRVEGATYKNLLSQCRRLAITEGNTLLEYSIADRGRYLREIVMDKCPNLEEFGLIFVRDDSMWQFKPVDLWFWRRYVARGLIADDWGKPRVWFKILKLESGEALTNATEEWSPFD
jgi:hypothetical protein